jgi:hypothetical protein
MLSDSACTTTRTGSVVIPSSCSLVLKPQSNTFWITANQTSRGYAPATRAATAAAAASQITSIALMLTATLSR